MHSAANLRHNRAPSQGAIPSASVSPCYVLDAQLAGVSLPAVVVPKQVEYLQRQPVPLPSWILKKVRFDGLSHDG
jgi:hypothetical protein